MTKQEEDQEKQRVQTLSDFVKDKELRQLNRQIATLEMKRGILTGTLYTWSGRYKALARDYGLPLVVWYWACWGATFGASYAAITVFGVDGMAIVDGVDRYMHWNLSSKMDPSWGQLGLALVVNELIEPLRLPLVIVTVKPVMDRFFPPKY